MAGPAAVAAWVAGLTGVKRALAAALLGAISVLAFAPFHLWPILFVSLGGLVWLLDGCHASRESRSGRLRCAALTGFWFGFGYFLTGLYWVAEAFLVEPWRHGWLIPFVMTALPAGMAMYFAAGCALAMLLWRRGPARVFALAFSLGLSELARGHLLTGFPWDVIGYGLVANEPLMQLSSVFGIDSLTVLAILLFAAPAAIWTGAAARSFFWPRASWCCSVRPTSGAACGSPGRPMPQVSFASGSCRPMSAKPTNGTHGTRRGSSRTIWT